MFGQATMISLLVSVVGCLGGSSILDATSSPAADDREGATRQSAKSGPTVLTTAPDLGYLLGVFVDDTGLYFAGGWEEHEPISGRVIDHGVIRHVSKNGSAVSDVWSGPGVGLGIVATRGDLFFLAYDYPDRTGVLNRIPKSGGTAIALGNWHAHGTCAAVMVASDVIFWMYTTGSGGGALNRTTPDGATVELTSNVTCPGAIAVARGRIFSASTNQVRSMPSAGVSGSVLTWNTAAAIQALAVSPSRPELYASVSGTLVKIREGDAKITTMASGLSADHIAADDRYVYLANGSPGYIMRVPIDGGPPAVLATGGRPTALAIDGNNVYWTDADGMAVLQVSKGI